MSFVKMVSFVRCSHTDAMKEVNIKRKFKMGFDEIIYLHFDSIFLVPVYKHQKSILIWNVLGIIRNM